MRKDLPSASRWRSRGLAFVFAAAALGGSSVALGLPWDIDMADGQQRKGYSIEMAPLPDGVVAQPSITSPKGFAPNYRRGSPESEALTNPMPNDEATLATGKAMFGIYCAPCHGADGAVTGPVGQPGRLPGVIPLAGASGVAKLRSDAYIYLTVRNGGAVMPAYGWAMSEEEIWSVVSHVRTLKDAKRVVPQETP